MKRVTVRCLTAAVHASVVLAAAAHAVDGVIEINDTSITAAGGYPFTIAAPGSYVLTGNLAPPPAFGALIVGAANVDLDLNGFSITGAGGPDGIAAAGFDGLSVSDGSVSGFTGTGIAAGPSSKIRRVRAVGNGTGIFGGPNCLILESVVNSNTVAGIDATNCKIENNVVEANAVGITGMGNLVIHNQILFNGGGGLLTVGGATILQNSFVGNGAFGISDGLVGPPPVPPPIRAPMRSVIVGNRIDATGAGPGISLSMPALIADNTISNSIAGGIVCGAACNVRGNAIETNNIGGVPGNGGVSVADGSTVNDNSVSFNLGFGLTLPLTSGYSQNTLNANGFLGLGPDVVSGGPHPTSGFMNLCSGVPGPAPTCP